MTCGTENEGRDAQKRVRILKKNELEMKWFFAQTLNVSLRNYGLEIRVRGGGNLVLVPIREPLPKFPMLPPCDHDAVPPSSDESSSSQRSVPSGLSSTPTSSSGTSAYNLRSYSKSKAKEVKARA